MEEIMTGVATQAQMGAFLTALRLRPGGETVQEITGLARIMREKAVQVHLTEATAAHALDTCGTGGDGAGTFNVSTAAGIVAAAAGASVAKHGNRSATSRCGSADVLEALGRTHRPWPRAGSPLRTRGRFRLHVRARVSSCHETCRPNAS